MDTLSSPTHHHDRDWPTTILCERIYINELGSGGLLDSLVIYTDR